MNDSTLNRRGALAFFGVGMVGAVVARSAQAATGSSGAPSVSPEHPESQQAPAPAVPVGLRAGSYHVAAVGPVVFGAFSITLANEQGDKFVVDVCARDHGVGAVAAPASTDKLEVFLVNEGDGNAPTHEAHGLAAMALAEVLRSHEEVITSSPLLTMRERLQRHGTSVLRSDSH